MRERSELFGENRSIFGIVTEPEGGAASAPKPAIVLLNAGLMHHIGPFRMYVLLARALSALGFTVLRFDLSSKGDTPARSGNLSYRESVRADVGDALDFLERSRGLRQCVLLGLCSGAGDAFDCALEDSRVIGLALLDGYAYRTPGFYLRHFAPRLMNPARWPGYAGRLLKRGVRPVDGQRGAQDDVYGMAFPPKKHFHQGLKDVLERRGAILIVHTGGWFAYYNHADQFREAFPDLAKHPAVRVHYFRMADHTYTLVSDRTSLIKLVCSWAASTFHPGPR